MWNDALLIPVNVPLCPIPLAVEIYTSSLSNVYSPKNSAIFLAIYLINLIKTSFTSGSDSKFHSKSK